MSGSLVLMNLHPQISSRIGAHDDRPRPIPPTALARRNRGRALRPGRAPSQNLGAEPSTRRGQGRLRRCGRRRSRRRLVRRSRASRSDIEPAAAASSSQVEPTTLPDCAVVLAGLQAAKTTPDTVVVNDMPTDTSASAGDEPGSGFKGIVTILTIDGPRLTFRSDEPNTPTSGTGTLDAATVWVDGPTHLDSPPTLQVGEQLGLATTPASDGVDHVVFIDVGASAVVDEKPAPDKKLTTPAGSSRRRTHRRRPTQRSSFRVPPCHPARPRSHWERSLPSTQPRSP